VAAGWRDLRWRLLAPAVVALVTVEVLRVWLPTISLGAAQVTGIRPTVGGLLGLVVLLAVPLLLGIGRLPPGLAWPIGTAGLVLGRLGLLVDGGYPLRLAASTVAVTGGVLALSALAGAGAGRIGRTGVLLGAVMASWLHVGLATLDLTWRGGPGAVLGGLALAAAVAGTAVRIAPPTEADPADAAWPWAAMGPVLLLLLLLVVVPGRIAVAVPWTPVLVAGVAAAAGGTAVMAALLAPLGPRRVVAPIAGMLTIAGTAAALPVDGTLAVVAKIVLAAGLGLLVGSASGSSAVASPAQRGAASGLGWALLGLLTVGYYAPYDVGVPISGRALLVAAAGVLTLIGFVARRRVGPIASEPLHPGRAMARTVALTLLVAIAVAVPAAPTTPVDVAPGRPGDPIRLVLANLNHGWDPEGRFDPIATATTLAALEPDVVVLTEVDRGWLVGGGHDLLQLLAGQLGLAHVFAPAADEVSGTALLTRFPVREHLVERLPRGSDPVARSQLTAILAVATTGEGPDVTDVRLGIVATQLSPEDPRSDTRLPQARAVAGMVARLRERAVPTVVVGDLHAPAESPEREAFGELVRDALPATAADEADDPALLASAVLHSEDLTVLAAEVVDARFSDQRPIVVTFLAPSPG
jgi:endonuclease/exonuclease/phosphatase family metal-dependent hydrolase